MKPKNSFKRCVAFCSANSYDQNGLVQVFKRKSYYYVRQTRDLIHLHHLKNQADIFIFNYGSFVCWGLEKAQEQALLTLIKEFEIESLAQTQVDHFLYELGEEISIDSHERHKIDVITLDSDNAQVKLAISYALSQSIKLEAFEDAIQVTIKKNGYLPEEIARKGMISLTRASLFKRIGEIFIARSSINLNSEYLESPEFFWRNPALEPSYAMVKNFLEIPSRAMALNQKLDVLQELLDILNSQVQHRYSSFLETIIILLIAIEISITLLQIYIHGL